MEKNALSVNGLTKNTMISCWTKSHSMCRAEQS